MINGAKATVKTGRSGSYTENPPAIVGSGINYVVNAGTTFTCTGYYVVVSGSYWYLQTLQASGFSQSHTEIALGS